MLQDINTQTLRHEGDRKYSDIEAVFPSRLRASMEIHKWDENRIQQNTRSAKPR